MDAITLTLTPEQLETAHPMILHAYRTGGCVFGEVLRNHLTTDLRLCCFDRPTGLKLRKIIEAAFATEP